MYFPSIVYRVARTRSKCILTRQRGRVISSKTRPSSSRNQAGWEVRHTESLHPLRFTTEKAGADKVQPRLFNFVSRPHSRAEIFHVVKQHLLAFLKSDFNLIRGQR